MSAYERLILNLPTRDMTALRALAAHDAMTMTAVARQAIQLYCVVSRRLRAGDDLAFVNGDRRELVELVGLGLGGDASAGTDT
jgi:hypothetical protein